MIQILKKLLDHQTQNFLGGPKCISMNETVNFFANLTPLFIILIFIFGGGQPNLRNFMYFMTHSLFQILWLQRDKKFPDTDLQFHQTKGSCFIVSLFLIIYTGYPLSIVLGYTEDQSLQKIELILSVLTYVLGNFMMYGGDLQIHYTRINPQLQQLQLDNLSLKEKFVFGKGIFKFSKYTNYYGEILIYLSFGICVGNKIAYLLSLNKIIAIILWMVVKNNRIVEVGEKQKQN